MKQRSPLHRRRSARGRFWLVAYLLLAVAWPSIGPMPWVIDAALHDSHPASAEANAGDHHHDASDIPGSPTHPDDHNCFQCEVIKHLARCVPGDGCFPTVAQVYASSSAPTIRTESIHTAFVVPCPPIRGPPSLNG